ncbi:MAG: 3-hydroxyisobutyrate dehydrogenase [Rhodobacterales bacterium RIFCSPHIGHO2_02_FULL_62_130]|nr:MAG: 3-hydroxyisobutyrate dehydrogenase [Rhodobacterales bacterium RIFCSPHIGHO2_02_FULL_62_130]OHC60587.1 MAG: 3-hydroxyisobutyrate dehydrogenase [Rhodobacterales bacterium RIFCSPHIGHO2_12_FULL_62_75]
MKYGYIGLGNLGGHLAASLIRDGFDVVVFDRDTALSDRHRAMGATVATSAADLAGQVDHVFTCLPSPAVSEAVLAEVLTTLKPGSTWIENSTLGRDDIVRLGGLAAESGVNLLESPVTGGVHLAARGEITVLVGGDKALFDLHKPALQAIGNKIFHMGPLGSAAVIKVITNMLAFIHLVADGEALMLAKRGGLDLKTAWEAITASSGTSFVHETEGQLILNGSYDIAFTMDLALKDLGFAMGFGREFGVPLDLAGLTAQTFLKGKAAYGGAAQSTQIVKLLEDVLKTDLRAEGFPARLE